MHMRLSDCQHGQCLHFYLSVVSSLFIVSFSGHDCHSTHKKNTFMQHIHFRFKFQYTQRSCVTELDSETS